MFASEEKPNLPFDINQPHIYRHCDEVAFENTLKNGVLWFRPDNYFRDMEEKDYLNARKDKNEGLSTVNLFGNHGFALFSPSGPDSKAEIRYNLPKHYILSMSSEMADKEQIQSKFNTNKIISIRNIQVLLQYIANDLNLSGYSNHHIRADYIKYMHDHRVYNISRDSYPPPDDTEFFNTSFHPHGQDYFVKRPIFSYQDEYRIVIQFFDSPEKKKSIYIHKEEENKLEVSIPTPNSIFEDHSTSEEIPEKYLK